MSRDSKIQRKPYIAPITHTPFIVEKVINPEQIEQLYSTILEGDINKLRMIKLEGNIAFNTRLPDTGESLIHRVLRNESLSEKQKYTIVQYLISQNVSVSLPDKYNVTPLHLATKYQNEPIVKLLLQYGADSNATDNQLMTPLHYATLGLVTSCNNTNNTNNKLTNNISQTDKLFKDITQKTIDILYTKCFNDCLKTIKNTYTNIQIVLPQMLLIPGPQNIQTDFINKINNPKVLTDNNLILNEIINFREQLRTEILVNNVTDKLSDDEILDLLDRVKTPLVPSTTPPCFDCDDIIISMGDDVNSINKLINDKRKILVQKVLELWKNNFNRDDNNNNILNNNILINNLQELKDKLLKSIPDNSLLDRNNIVYIIVGKIVDDLIITHIKFSIYDGVNKYIKSILENKTLRELDTPLNLPNNLIPIFNVDTDFEIQLNELFDEIINKYYTTTNIPTKEFKELMLTTEILKENQTKPFIIYNFNYDFGEDITVPQCLKVSPQIIDDLINNRANVYAKDINNNTPIYYAIQSQNPELINRILSKINDKTLVLNTIFKLYLNNNNLLSNNISNDSVAKILNSLTTPLYDKIVDNIQINNNSNNKVIIKYLDIVLPQLILMYNNLFYYYMNNNTSIKKEDYKNLLLKYNLIKSNNNIPPLLDNINEYLVNSSIELNALIDKNKKIFEYISLLNKKTSRTSNQEAKLQDYLKKKTILENNISNKRVQLTNSINENINKFITNKKQLQKTPSQLYTDIFNNIIKSSSTFNFIGYEDYLLYNSLWDNLIKNNDKLKNIYNIHLVTILLQNRLLCQTKNFYQTKKELELVNELYQNVIIPTINDINTLPSNTEENYVLVELLNIMNHIVSSVVGASLYYSVIKVITKYIIKTTPKPINLTKDEYHKYITTTMDSIIKYNNYELKEYIIDIMPMYIIKYILKIDNFDTVESLDVYFNKITNIITLNTIIPIDSNSDMIIKLQEYVYKYYKEIYTQTIQMMKITIDNYNRYIMNEYRYVKIFTFNY